MHFLQNIVSFVRFNPWKDLDDLVEAITEEELSSTANSFRMPRRRAIPELSDGAESVISRISCSSQMSSASSRRVRIPWTPSEEKTSKTASPSSAKIGRKFWRNLRLTQDGQRSISKTSFDRWKIVYTTNKHFNNIPLYHVNFRDFWMVNCVIDNSIFHLPVFFFAI